MPGRGGMWEKPTDARIRMPGGCRPPLSAILMLPTERGGTQVRDWVTRAVSNAWVNSPTWGPTGVQFAASSSQYITLPRNTALERGLPISGAVRFKLDAINTANELYASHVDGSNYAGHWLAVDVTGAVNCNFGSLGSPGPGTRRSAFTPASTTTTGVWYTVHYVMRGATDMSIYVNGLPVSVTYSGTGGALAWKNADQNICRAYTGSWWYLSGAIEWIMIWPGMALSAAEVRAHYQDPYMWFRPRVIIGKVSTTTTYSIPHGLIYRIRQPISAIGGGA